MIYLDNAATTLQKPEQVAQSIVDAMHSMGNAGRGATSASLDASRTIYDTRVKLAKLFAVKDPSRIAFTCNSTESLNLAIKGSLHRGDHVVTTVLEHNSVLRPLYEMEEKGVELTILTCDDVGMISYDDLESAIQENTKAIVCTHGSNLTGNVIDVKRVGRLARKYGVLLIVDASQTAGVLDIHVEQMNIDILCFTGHKGLLGPQGTGGIYVREGIFLHPLKVGGSGTNSYNKKHPMEMPTAVEAGTLNGHGIAGLHGALTYIEEVGVASIREKELELMWKFYDGVKEIEQVKIYGDLHQKRGSKEERCAIVTMNIGDYDSAEVSDELLVSYDISTRSGAHCAPLMHEALGTKEQGAVRFSFSHYNTVEEVDCAIQAIRELAMEE